MTDWVIVRNRLSTLGSRNKRLVGEGVHQLARQLGFRSTDGFAERVVYREFFPRGLTALDDINEDTLGLRPTVSHVTARDEVTALIEALKLPIDERGKRRVAARAEDAPILRTEDFTLDLAGKRAWREEQEVRLTATEWGIVEFLARNPGRLVTQGQLLERVWGLKDTKNNYVRVYLAAIRRKLEPDPAHPRYFLTEPRSGIRFDPIG